MIFKKKHVEQILNGEKTQTRRVNQGYYKVGQDYAIQPCRTCKGIPGYRIRILRICVEYSRISKEDAIAEGGYTPDEFEVIFRQLNPKWGGAWRHVFTFEVIP